MPRYEFVVAGEDGERHKVVLDKASEAEARASVAAKGFRVVEPEPRIAIRTAPVAPAAAPEPADPVAAVRLVGVDVPFGDLLVLLFRLSAASAVVGAVLGAIGWLLWRIVAYVLAGGVTPP